MPTLAHQLCFKTLTMAKPVSRKASSSSSSSSAIPVTKEASQPRTPRRSKKRKLTKPKVKIKKKSKFKVEGVTSFVEKKHWLQKRQEKIKKQKELKKEGVSPLVEKYWVQRHDLFSRYDRGVKLDEEGWYSVTPEEIAIRQAERCGGRSVIDCFCGVGGNAIQFAKMCYHVVAIDIDPQKVKLAFNNAKIYGVEDYIDFIVGDFFQLAPSLKGDIVFLSPPWGGPSYQKFKNFTLDFLKPKDGYSLFKIAQNITPNIIMFLPRNVDLQQVEELAWLSAPPLDIEIQENYVRSMLKGITVYYGDAAFWAT